VAVAVAGIGLEPLLANMLPENLRDRYRFSLVGPHGRLPARCAQRQRAGGRGHGKLRIHSGRPEVEPLESRTWTVRSVRLETS